MKFKIYRDSFGSLQVDVPSECQAVSFFLEEDVQESSVWCKKLIQIVDDVKKGKIPQWEGTGNANTLILRPDGARIETELHDPPQVCELSLEDLGYILTDWLNHIEEPFKQGYFKKFELPVHITLPDSVKTTLWKIWGKKYRDLYQKDGGNLDEALEELFNLLSPQIDLMGHLRCVYLGWALALAARPMILAYLPNDTRTDIVLNLVEQWVTTPELINVDKYQNLFSELEHTGYQQALGEALLVYRDLLKMLPPNTDYRSAILDILDTCLTGYAIFPPPPDGTRDLFNWLLVEVIPAAYCCMLPQKIYTKEWPWPPQENGSEQLHKQEEI